MSIWGGTAPKADHELVSPWAIHLRRTPAVRNALVVAHSTYDPPNEEKSRPRGRARTRGTSGTSVNNRRATTVPTYPLPAGYALAPSGVRRWLDHVYALHLRNPSLSRAQAVGEAIMTFNGSMNDAWSQDYPYQGLPAV